MSRTASSSDPLSWLRDTVQARLVARLFSEATHDLVLKGGMAMRVLHEGARATKDIDLDADHDLPLHSIQHLVRRSIKEAAQGLLTDLHVTEPKQTETTLRWKIGGTDPTTNQVLHLTVEISRRHKVDPKDVQKVQAASSSLFPRYLNVYNSQTLAFTKVKALLSDTRDAPRDIADLYLLINAQVKPPIRQLRDWINQNGPVALQSLWAKIDSMDEARFNTEVRPSLNEKAQTTLLFSDWDSVRLTVGQHVEAWLVLAQSQEKTEDEKDTEKEKESASPGGKSCRHH